MRALLAQMICLMCNMQVLWLDENKIGDPGLKALADACAGEAMANVTELILSYNQIGDVGMQAFADAIKPTAENGMGAMAQLQVSSLSAALTMCSETRHARSPGLTVSFDVPYTHVQTLYLYNNQIGDVGVTAFADACARGALASLEELTIWENPGNTAALKEACKKRGIKC